MDEKTIKEALLKGERVTLECKKAKSEVPKELWNTYSAFANTIGGLILLGIEEHRKETDPAKRFEIIGVDCGDKTVKWKHWVDSLKDDMPWRHVIMGRKLYIQQDYRIKGYPTKVLIDPEGKIIKSFVGEDPRFYLLLEELFAK